MSLQPLTNLLQTLRVLDPTLRPFAHYDTGPSFQVALAGATSLSVWFALRQAVSYTGYWPLLLGDAAALAAHEERLARAQAHDTTTPFSMTRELLALQTANPETWFQARARRWWPLRDRNQRVEPPLMSHPLPVTHPLREPSWRLATNPYDVEINTMTIPTTVVYPSSDSAEGLRVVPATVVSVGLFPAQAAWQLPLYLRSGGWNESPPYQTHAVVWRWWETHYGAEIVGMADTRLEAWVASPPVTPPAIARLAWEMEQYCPEREEQIPDSSMRADLRVWRFAWH